MRRLGLLALALLLAACGACATPFHDGPYTVEVEDVMATVNDAEEMGEDAPPMWSDILSVQVSRSLFRGVRVRGYIVTVAHGIESDEVVIRHRDTDRWRTAEVLVKSEEADVAVLRDPVGQDDVLEIRTLPVVPGESLWMLRPRQRVFGTATGVVVARFDEPGVTGDSGSAVVDEDGKLVGIVFGRYRDGAVAFVPTFVLEHFLEQAE